VLLWVISDEKGIRHLSNAAKKLNPIAAISRFCGMERKAGLSEPTGCRLLVFKLFIRLWFVSKRKLIFAPH
jgi:hypothetical protein